MNPCNTCPTFMVFGSKRCCHCVKLEPVLEELKKKSKHGAFHLSQYDCEGVDHELAQVMRIHAWPTILVFVPILDPRTKKCTNYTLLRYPGDRDVTSMTNHIMKREYLKTADQMVYNIDPIWAERFRKLITEQQTH